MYVPIPSMQGGNTNLPTVAPVSFDNCVQYSNLQVSWTVNRANNEVDFQLCGCRTLDPRSGKYCFVMAHKIRISERWRRVFAHSHLLLQWNIESLLTGDVPFMLITMEHSKAP